MNPCIVHLSPDLIERVEALARREERTRAAQLRYLIRLALEVVEMTNRRPKDATEASSGPRGNDGS